MRIEVKTTKARSTGTHVTSTIVTGATRVITTLTCEDHAVDFELANGGRVNLVLLNRVRACPKSWCSGCRADQAATPETGQNSRL
jgi:small ligand-binding sensory domain FIST